MSHSTSLPSSLRIGVLRGGPSSEYDVSLKSGAHVLKHLSGTHRPIDIFISKDGVWHMGGIEKSPERILKHVDVVFNALHGTYGEDGKVQAILDSHGIPYTGSKKYESSIAMNKWLTKEKLKTLGIKTPISVIVREGDSISEKVGEVFTTIPHPIIVKPVSGGSSIGLSIVRNPAELVTAIEGILRSGDSVLIEECITGKEATCGVIENFRDKDVYALPPVEIVTPEGKLFDYESKYAGTTEEICPGRFTEKEKEEIERLSALVHKSLGLSHYSRSDFIISPKRGIYFLEVNTLPGLDEHSPLSKSFDSVGIKVKDFLHHVLHLAFHKSGIWI